MAGRRGALRPRTSGTGRHDRRALISAVGIALLLLAALAVDVSPGRTVLLAGWVTRFLLWVLGSAQALTRGTIPARAMAFTGNVVVRLLLDTVGVPAAPNEKMLKGGRVLGPMERLFIVGLGLAGHATTASIVVAAKAAASPAGSSATC